jgi:hypothetical protein
MWRVGAVTVAWLCVIGFVEKDCIVSGEVRQNFLFCNHTFKKKTSNHPNISGETVRDISHLKDWA